MFQIRQKATLAPGIKEMVIDAPLIAASAEPGQFVIIHLDETGKRIPLTIADFDRPAGTITIVFQEMGKTTHRLGLLPEGESIPNLLGPQGNPSETGGDRNAVVVGGGIGVAPVYPLARKLRENGVRVTAITGYRSREHIFWKERMESVSDRLLVATNDGSFGRKGFVTDLLAELLNAGEPVDRVYAIGPAVMMRAVAETTRPAAIPTVVSLNSLMVCGMGMCGACRATVGGKTRFTCLDGPDFDGHEVNFEELMQRLGTYREEEKISFDAWKEEAGHED